MWRKDRIYFHKVWEDRQALFGIVLKPNSFSFWVAVYASNSGGRSYVLSSAVQLGFPICIIGDFHDTVEASWIAKKRREEPLFGTIGRSGTSTSSLTTMCFSMCIIQGPSELGAADRMEVVESNIRLDRCLISFGWLELYFALQHFIMTKASDHRPLLLYTDNQPGALPPAKPAANRELPPEHKEPSQWKSR